MGGVFPDTLLNKKSPTLDPTISTLFPRRRLALSLGDGPAMDDRTDITRSMPNWRAMGPNSILAELLEVDHPEFIRCFHSMLAACGEREKSPAIERCAHLPDTLLNKKSPTLDPTISTLFPRRRLALSLGDGPAMDDRTEITRSMPNWRAMGPNSILAE